jgi:hypothetical protein
MDGLEEQVFQVILEDRRELHKEVRRLRFWLLLFIGLSLTDDILRLWDWLP